MVLNKAFELDGDVIAVCPQFSSAGAVIRNNTFSGSPAKGIRQQSPDVLIENNEISFTGGTGLSLFGQPSYWGEGPYVYNAKVLNNYFHDTVISQDALSAGAIVVREVGYRENQLSRNVVIRGNRIEDTGGSGIIAAGVNGLEIVDNSVTGYAMNPSFPGKRTMKLGANYGFVIDSSSNVLEQGNTIEAPGAYSEGERFIYEVDFR